MRSRFREGDRVSATIPDCEGATVPGVVKKVETSEESDTEELVFLVEYDVPVDGRNEGFHAVHELRLIPGENDKAPPSTPEEPKSSLPSYEDYRSKVTARMNTAFDALFCKRETEERWEDVVTIKGQYLLRLQLQRMTLLDIAQLYGELERGIFSLTITGLNPGLRDAYRNLSREILHACLIEGCYLDVDGQAVRRFRKSLGEEGDDPRPLC